MFKIEDNIPPPVGVAGRYGLHMILPGQSVFIPEEAFPPSGPSAIRASASQHFGRGNYTTRMECGGLRVWRLA